MFPKSHAVSMLRNLRWKPDVSENSSIRVISVRILLLGLVPNYDMHTGS